MEYILKNIENNLKETILKINNIKEDDLDLSSFSIDYNDKALFEFREKLVSFKDKKILIVGDYDCDGICATTILVKLLKHLQIECNYYIPSRLKEGYGLNENIVHMAKDNNFEVIITVDNGVTAINEIKLAKSLGLNVMIIDHHEYNEKPDVDGLLHYAVLDKRYNQACSSGLCCLLALCFYEDELSLVLGGLGTQADMVSVFGYNRYLLKKMMAILNKGNTFQINALSNKINYTYDDLSFSVIPKINAISRLDNRMNVNLLVRYFLSDKKSCLDFAIKINEVNDERKSLTNEMANIASGIIENHNNIIVVKSDRFQEGLCGLIANRMMYNYNKPVIVLAFVDHQYRGSARSLENSNIYDYLFNAKEYMVNFGGHSSACGLTIEETEIDKFIAYLDNNKFEYKEVAKEAILITNDMVNMNNRDLIDSYRPYGVDFKEPLFCLKDAIIENKIMIKDKYPKFILGNNASALSFNTSFKDVEFKDIYGHLTNDSYKPFETVLMIEDLK